MNIGHLNQDNEKFINNYKSLGYPTKTGLIEEAVSLLRNRKEAELRKKILLEAAKTYTVSEHVWEPLDQEDFYEHQTGSRRHRVDQFESHKRR